jgi:GntR family transcriptional regulator, N-acetylglucosamine utilization regulator
VATRLGTRLRDGPVPKHSQLRDILLRLIEDELAPDALVPSERELGARYGVSRATVRESIGQLVNERRLYRVRGKGTYVAAPRVDSQLHLESFTQDMLRRGLEPSTVLIRSEAAVPAPSARAALGLQAGQPAYRLERLRIAAGEPMAYERGWYTPHGLEGLLQEDLTGSLYSLFEDRFGMVIDGAQQTVWAECADHRLADQLTVRAGMPLLVFRRTATAAGHVVEHVTSWYRGDRYQVHMTLDRNQTSEQHDVKEGSR